MAPGIPTNVTATATGSDRIAVSWDTPVDDGNSAITGYLVQRAYLMANGSRSPWTNPTSRTDRIHTARSLTAETTYYFQVAAVNAIGTGGYSDGAASATTEAIPTTALTGLRAVVLHTSIIVLWTRNSAQNTDLLRVALFNENITALADVDEPVVAFNLATGSDPGQQVYNGVPRGSYRVGLAATGSDGSVMVNLFPDTLTVN